MGVFLRRSILTAAAAVAVLAAAHSTGLAAFSLRWPFVHHNSHEWTQFRNGPDNNAVVPGRLETSWRIETGGQISASPTLVDGILYIGNNVGRFYALDPTNGHVVWTYSTQNALMSAPIVYGDDVYLGEGDAQSMSNNPSEPIHVGQGSSSLVALDRKTGALRWKRTLGGSAMPTPAIVDGLLVEHNGAGWVGGFDPVTGERRFAKHLESVASMSAILPMGGGEFVTTGVGTNAVWRMNAHDGSVVWDSVFYRGSSGIGDCPPVSDGTRIMCDYVAPTGSDTSTAIGRPATERVFSIDAATGKKQWDVPLETGTLPPRNEAAIPLLADGVLCVGSSVAPAMHGIDPATGRVLWTVKTRGPVKSGAVYVDGLIYFGDYGGYLWAVDPHTGGVIGDEFVRTIFNVGSPIVDGKTLIIGSDSGTLFALPLAEIRSRRDG
ncbi:MAG TPA: PQQ-binding-like beta-propeller repeat protein [Candidatus Acidoferrales bacterium]|nr:PQQ-binding-like beta-propeller repeat protein [Candidatus Acidoferrales bacterium]